MNQTYSQELIEEIKGMISDRIAVLKAMDREALSAEYLKVVGVEPHPRMLLDMMVKMIARFYQGELWHQKTGDIPLEIREKDMKFWLRMEAYFVPKAALKEEQAQPIAIQNKKKKLQLEPQGLPGSGGTGLQSKAKNIEESTLVVLASPKTDDQTEIAKAFLLIESKGNNGRMSYANFLKECKKKKLNTPPHMLVLLLKRQGFIKLEYATEEASLASSQVKEDKGITFTEVLKSVETDRPKLLVEPECVDFGTGKRVSDYVSES